MSVIEQDPALTPGAMQAHKSRSLNDGSEITYEYAPAGWLAKNGQPRLRDWRAYHLVTPQGQSIRVPSVTTILDAICPKPGLPPWAEARGIEGAVRAVQLGEIDTTNDASVASAVDTVRSLRLGADRARDEAATRGLDVHACLEDYNRTGSAPEPSDYPPEHLGYLRGLTRWLLHANPEPLSIEELVAHTDGYAGRLDLIAHVGGLRTVVDLKTSEKGAIYSQGHLQARMYARAAEACGDEPADRVVVVVVSADGSFREMECAASEAAVRLALDYYGAFKPIDAACESANRAERKARQG